MEIVLKSETFMMVANNEKEKDTWVSKISQAIVDYSSISICATPILVSGNNNNNSSGSGISVSSGMRSSSSSLNLSDSAAGDSTPGREEDSEDGLLTFDDNP